MVSGGLNKCSVWSGLFLIQMYMSFFFEGDLHGPFLGWIDLPP